jgi:hypothetical protein
MRRERAWTAARCRDPWHYPLPLHPGCRQVPASSHTEDLRLLGCANRLPDSTGLSSRRQLVADEALDAVLRAVHRRWPGWISF